MPSSLFAPPHIPGNAAAEAALDEWNAQHPHLTSAQIDELRMPAQGVPAGGAIPKRGAIVPGVSGDPFGTVDPNALRAAAMGTPYDIEARRNAIAGIIANATTYGADVYTGSHGGDDIYTGRK